MPDPFPLFPYREPKANPNTGAALRRSVLRSLEAQYASPGAITQTRPSTDPQNQTAASLLSLNAAPRLTVGTITDSTAIASAYRVQFEKVKEPMAACLLSSTTASTYGTREIRTLQPGTMVYCILHEQLNYAYIIGVLTPPTVSARNSQHSIIHGASRNRVDEAHKKPVRAEGPDGIPSFTAGRPFDAIHGGEVGWITETGMKFTMDSFMSLLGVDESCQLSFHYHDMLCRLAAQQFQLWTSGRETESFNDQDEIQDWTGYAMYPWEMMGLAARADPTRVLAAAEWQIDKPYYGKMEPLDDYMMPFQREREWHGYLGQGYKHSVVAPPLEFTDSGDMGSDGGVDQAVGTRTQHLSYMGGSGTTEANHPGLFDQFVTADGRFCMQAAKGLHFSKRSAIMLPTRRKRPEEPDGDNPSNYQFSGVLGEGEDHKITGDLETTGEHSGMSRAMGVMDMHAYFFNYAGVHPFFYHSEDYKLYEESDASWANGQSAATPDYGVLSSEAYIDPEDYRKTWNIDHRYGEQQFYTLSSGLDFLDDGGVLLYDGYGASLRMSGGAVEISAPGDVWLKSGRNTNVWAGYDAVIRAKHSWDITASEFDGRLKAERNLFTLSGNGGIGGTLIESRGEGPVYDFENEGELVSTAGVMIRSTQAPFVAWSQQVYLRTGGPEIEAGPITLDAGKGAGEIVLRGNTAQNYLNGGMFWHFNTNDDQVDGPTAMITESGAAIPGNLIVGASVIGGGPAVFDGGVAAKGAFVAVSGAPFVGELKDEQLEAVQATLDSGQDTIERQLPETVGQPFIDSLLKPMLYDVERPGHDDTIEKAQFSLRVQEDYKTEEFVLYEDRWQQLSRLAEQSLPKWRENTVLYRGRETFPYPGKEAFQAGDKYVQQTLTLFSAENGRSNDRGTQPELSDDYQTPKFGAQTAASLNDYSVIR